MHSSRRVRSTGRLAALAALSLAVASCGGDSGGGEGGGPILIGNLADLSGPTADVGTPYSEGVRGYVEWRNSQGGIAGREIELLWEDYQYDVAVAERLYTDYVAQGVVAIQGWGTADTEALRGLVNADEIPFLSASYSEQLTHAEQTPYNFVVGTSYSDQMRIALSWISQQDPGAEVAVFHHDSPFGTSPVEDGQAYIDENGLDLGYRAVTMPGGATDYVGELRRMEEEGVGYLVVQNVESPAALLARDVADQGLDIQLVLLNWAGGELFIEFAGEAAEGAVSVQPWAPVAHQVPGQDDAREFLAEAGGSMGSLHYTQGWWTMAVLAEGIEAVIDSGQEVTGPAIRDALGAIEAFDTGGVSLPITLAPRDDGRRVGMVCSPMWEVSGGQWTQLSDESCP
jgi:branched-chain amino acid transport system substrate-binding protein